MIRRRVALASVAALGAAVAVGAVGCPGPGSDSPASVTRLKPNNGPTSGGTSILILGSNFGDAGGPVSVLFGGVEGSDAQVLSPSEIQVTIPAYPVGNLALVPVDLTVRASGHVATVPKGFEYLAISETEPCNQGGYDDSFANYQQIPLETVFTGCIGVQGDVDVYHLHPPDDGQLFISADFAASYTSGGLAGMRIEFFHGPDPTPNPDAYFGGEITQASDVLSVIPSISQWLRQAYYFDGHGPYLRVTGVGNVGHAGYDPIHPYHLFVHYVPGTVEPPPPQDSFYMAIPIPQLPAGGVYNSAGFMDPATIDQDFDWYSFVPARTGWVRVSLNAGALGTGNTIAQVELNGGLYWQDPTNPNNVQGVGEAATTVGNPGSPEPYGNVFEAARLSSNNTYFLRLYNTNLRPFAPYAYPVKVERGDGAFESAEPSGLLPAETEYAPNDLGTLTANVPKSLRGYCYHWSDPDWFRLTTPAGASSLTVSWDHTKIRNQIGDYDPRLNPFGGGATLMVFDTAWIGNPSHTAVLGQALASDPTPATNIQAATATVSGGAPYWIFLDCLQGYSLTSAYTLTVTAN